MYIVNEHGITHSIPDEWKVPAGARKASKEEIADYEGAAVAPPAATGAPDLALVNAVADRDAEIAQLKAALVQAVSNKASKAK